MERILFSPLGDTDPVRGCYDGAMLHILRHYQPERIVLFYTQDMAEKEHRDHRYTRAIHRTASDCVIEEIFTDIQEAHLYPSVRFCRRRFCGFVRRIRGRRSS